MRARVLAALFWSAAIAVGLALSELRQREEYDALRGVSARSTVRPPVTGVRR